MGNGQITQYLLDAGTPPNYQDESGATALHYAAQGNHKDCINELLLK